MLGQNGKLEKRKISSRITQLLKCEYNILFELMFRPYGIPCDDFLVVYNKGAMMWWWKYKQNFVNILENKFNQTSGQHYLLEMLFGVCANTFMFSI